MLALMGQLLHTSGTGTEFGQAHTTTETRYFLKFMTPTRPKLLGLRFSTCT